jgi:site-specific recombinase XerD
MAVSRARDKRHTFCTHLAMGGAPASTIEALVGHADLTTTLQYMHLVEGRGSRRSHSSRRRRRPLQQVANPKKLRKS